MPRLPDRQALRHFLRAAWPTMLPPLIAALGALALWLALPPQRVMAVMIEGGPIERLTEWGYIAVAALIWLAPPPAGQRRGWLALSVLLLAAAAREMDLHKHWTGYSVLKVSFYFHAVPLWHKLLALAVLGLIAWAALHWLRRPRADWLRPVTIWFFVTMVVSKILDRAINLLAEDWGIHTSESILALVSALEESIELALPLIAAYGLWGYARRWRR